MTLGGAISEPAWRSKPSWYLIATDDRMIPPPAQRFTSKRAGASAESSSICSPKGLRSGPAWLLHPAAMGSGAFKTTIRISSVVPVSAGARSRIPARLRVVPSLLSDLSTGRGEGRPPVRKRLVPFRRQCRTQWSTSGAIRSEKVGQSVDPVRPRSSSFQKRAKKGRVRRQRSR